MQTFPRVGGSVEETSALALCKKHSHSYQSTCTHLYYCIVSMDSYMATMHVVAVPMWLLCPQCTSNARYYFFSCFSEVNPMHKL